MTENKQFKLHIKWFNLDKTNGEATLTDNGQPILCTESIEDARLLKNLLNDLYEENEQLNKSRDELIYENRHIKKTIQTMLINERTAIGKSVLKQLWDAINME